MNLDYVAPLESSIVSPLLRDGADGIPQALGVLSEYCLVREDLESLGELTSWPNTQNRFSQVESKVNYQRYCIYCLTYTIDIIHQIIWCVFHELVWSTHDFL